MQTPVRISKTAQALLRCPVCHKKLSQDGEQFVCTNSACGSHFPIVDGIPVVLNEQLSVFSIEDFISHKKTFFNDTGDHAHSLQKTLFGLTPSIGKNIGGEENYRRLSRLLRRQADSPRVLVIGGSIPGKGMEPLFSNQSLELIETDVSFGPRTVLICDAHDIPFDDGSFDCVVIQAVLEHVVDPYRCVDEIYRVLNARGLVYAETPFMQQVHGGRYDFTRFTYLGHRRLFRRFEEITSGAVCGPGMALAWSYQYFLLSFTSSRVLRGLIRLFAAFTTFYLKYFDLYLIRRAEALDAASAYYFMGRKGRCALPDRDLIKLYKGKSS